MDAEGPNRPTLNIRVGKVVHYDPDFSNAPVCMAVERAPTFLTGSKKFVTCLVCRNSGAFERLQPFMDPPNEHLAAPSSQDVGGRLGGA